MRTVAGCNVLKLHEGMEGKERYTTLSLDLQLVPIWSPAGLGEEGLRLLYVWLCHRASVDTRQTRVLTLCLTG